MDYVPDAVRPLRRVEYEQLFEAGLLTKDDRVELLRGFMVRMSPIGAPHAATVNRLTELFVLAVNKRATVSVQNPLAALDDSEPQPDLMVLPRGDYDGAHPTNAFLVVEVSDSSLKKDRGVKLGIYAEAGVPEYWIVNLKNRRIERYTEPEGVEYREIHHFEIGESLAPLHFPDFVLAVADVIK
jgi:Uma2 family endonuclease